MMLRRLLAALGMVLAAQVTAITSQAANHVITGPAAFATVANGNFCPILADDNNFVDFAQLVANEHNPGIFSQGFGKIAIAISFTLALWLLFWVVRSFYKRDLWSPVLAVAATIGNGQLAHKLYLALTSHEGSHRRNEKTGDTEFRRRRRRKVFNYSLFYCDVMAEISLHGTYEPPHAKKAGPANPHSPGAAAHANELLRAGVMDLLAGQQNLINEQKRLLQHQTKITNNRLPGHAPLPNWQLWEDHVCL